MAEENESTEEKSGNKLILIVVIVAVVLAGGGAAAWFFLSGSEEGPDAEVAEAVAEAPTGPAQYTKLKPLTVSYWVDNRQRFLQVTASIMSRDQGVIDVVETNLPLIENNLLNLFSAADFAEVTTLDGKEQLRQAALIEVQKVIDAESTEPPGTVEQVLFSSFIVQ
ncbi:MAG: flagellar basal body-associated FliL family protein [Pseudomonadota bacterium]|nr:flagellar basal body-associated FliL family protein [Pseudomonadota bacterium]